MLAKLVSKNQLTPPEAVLAEVGDSDYFDVPAEDRGIVPTSVRINRFDEVCAKLETPGITESEVADALV